MPIAHTDVKKSVIRSQHCQRNFDLTKQIPQEDIDLLVHAATNCPSKQNIAFYKLHVITDRSTIEAVHELTTGTHTYDQEGNFVESTNSQTLANVIFVFEQLEYDTISEKSRKNIDEKDFGKIKVFERDRATAVGIASGYVNLTAALLGYSTGCCQCMQEEAIQELLGLENIPTMIQGIGFSDPTRNRRLHEKTGNLFPTRKKEEIQVTRR